MPNETTRGRVSMELREKIAAIFIEALKDHGIDYGNVKGELAYAEDVIALPEIAEALALKAHRDTKVGYERQG